MNQHTRTVGTLSSLPISSPQASERVVASAPAVEQPEGMTPSQPIIAPRKRQTYFMFLNGWRQEPPGCSGRNLRAQGNVIVSERKSGSLDDAKNPAIHGTAGFFILQSRLNKVGGAARSPQIARLGTCTPLAWPSRLTSVWLAGAASLGVACGFLRPIFLTTV